MPSVAGDGYTLLTHEHAELVGPGMVHALCGQWTLGSVGDVLEEGESAHVLGTVAAFSPDDDPILVEVRTHQIVKVPSRSTPKPWGGEVEVEPWGQLKIISVAAGARTSLQKHVRKDECLIPMGSGTLEACSRDTDQDGNCGRQNCPHCHGANPAHIRPGTVHRATGPLLMAEGSTYHPDDVIRLEDDFGRE